ncbi:uncharacterized protein LOC143288227 [Babylonia areolata]|uniref:uncharacterized protein LOC143288227 n=1 Tax=Babylonia areolata TaxID=304850 RepID=UPI003FD4DCC9
MASPALVSGPSVPDTCSTTGTGNQTSSAEAASFGHSSLQSSNAPPARVAAVRAELSASPLKSSTPRSASVSAALTKGGASSDLLSIVSKARREGTETLYDFRWKKWLSWCTAQNIPPTNPTSMQLANFLAHCSSVLNLSASSVRGYRSAICTTIKQLGGPAFEADFLLREVARGASLKEARNPRRVPLWDLFLVLDFIRKQPFEPLGTIPFDLLTLKTTFLLLLATGRRRSEIHGLSGMPQDLAFHRDGSITLRFLPEFLAKNQDPKVPSPSLRVRPLSDILAQDDEDRHLCPVRCLKYYWDRSRHRRSSQRRLLISLNENYKKDIAAGTISCWVSQVIRRAYSQP